MAAAEEKLMEIREAAKASKNGAIAAFISGGATTLIFLYATGTNAQGHLALWSDPAIIVDIILIFVCAFGMLRNSRAAATTIFVYFLFAKIYIAVETGQSAGITTGLIFLYFYGKAIQGSFTYHKIKKADDPEYRPPSKWSYNFGIPLIVFLFASMGFLLLSEANVVPSLEVLAGSDVSNKDRSILVANEILYETEEIEYFYSYGLASILEGGSILTDRAVVVYSTDPYEGLKIYYLEFADIANVELLQDGNMWNDRVYKVNSHIDDAWLNIELTTYERGDIKFVETLRNKINQDSRIESL